METRLRIDIDRDAAGSPTRLEGMETRLRIDIDRDAAGSPTRLEGMETEIVRHPLLNPDHVSDPP